MLKVALCQTLVSDKKLNNLENAYRKISRAAFNGAKIVSLCEMFNCPYSGQYFRINAEEEDDSQSVDMLKKVAKEWQIYVVGGSIPELCENKVYNTSYVVNPQGEIIAKHRKIHLFDVDIQNGIRFKESDFLSSGNEVTVFDTIYGRIGLCICYDIRFPELIRKMSLMGAKMVFVPAAFNMTTGPAHWTTLFRARAIDNQVYMFGISPARDINGAYTSYGHSIIVNPWGEILNEGSEFEDIIYGEIDLDYVDKVRNEIPIYSHRKPELYNK
ncbi:carbon-nitrogen hydrolase [Fervidicella metallireducens AeB]|uniref:Carbon-nitrogen hydrolase n=1 Tax=Fervidicella metallireducens AeB TaxID=1403537 RepID=A0A017RYR9_9CLOT|nr:carbon-nitrogen hydrolase family protein [Fervidicella metallireducens]EYE89050.1 carbon-nitrogen hydrolase [Fervidicella metallireducens AeB]